MTMLVERWVIRVVNGCGDIGWTLNISNVTIMVGNGEMNGMDGWVRQMDMLELTAVRAFERRFRRHRNKINSIGIAWFDMGYGGANGVMNIDHDVSMFPPYVLW